jgi:transposase
MKTLSLDLRERVVAAYDTGDVTREDVAARFRVSLGMVKKLLQQRKQTGDLRPRHRFSGRKPLIMEAHRQQMRQFLGKRPDMTLLELRGAVGLSCTLPAIHYALAGMNLTYKKRHSTPASKSGRT